MKTKIKLIVIPLGKYETASTRIKIKKETEIKGLPDVKNSIYFWRQPHLQKYKIELKFKERYIKPNLVVGKGGKGLWLMAL